MRINCEILDLRAFLAILDAGSFHRAAAQLNMSQPSVSRRIKTLETALGVSLLERTTRRVKVTSIGRALDPMLRRLVGEFENCVFSLGDFGVRHPGEVTVASIATAASHFLPRVLKRFATAHPDIRFRIVDLSAEEGLEHVTRGEAEFGINFLGASRPDLKFTPLIDDHFVVACHSAHPFASRKSIKWSELSRQSLIISQRSGNRALIDQALARSNLRLNWSFEVVHLSTSFGLVEAGVGMSIIPRLARPLTEHRSMAVIPVCDPVIHRTVGIVERRTGQFSRAATAFRTMIVDEAKLFNDTSLRIAGSPNTRTKGAKRPELSPRKPKLAVS
jgi:DNA-binding transcriptional LysR family regulator